MQITDLTPLTEAQARRALEAFLTDNPELERLEGLLAQFNIFEALGAVRHEVRHSDFLAYLLNPQENHGLGDAFLKRLLQKALVSAGGADWPVTLIDLDFWNLDAATVQREWQRIDVILRDELHHFSVIIENKIDTGEHDDQLARYYERVRREFPNDRILALYLTKDGDEPTDDRYLPVGYGVVCEVVETLIERRASTLGPDVRTLMTHYAQMLRRHIMSDTEVARLCGLIYQKHKAALDLIFEHRPDLQLKLQGFLLPLIKQEQSIHLVKSSKSHIIFGFAELDAVPLTTVGNLTEAGKVLHFDLINNPDLLRILLWVGPGPADIRTKLITMAKSHGAPFKSISGKEGKGHKSIYTYTLLNSSDYEDADMEALEEKVRIGWTKFVEKELPALRSAIQQQT